LRRKADRSGLNAAALFIHGRKQSMNKCLDGSREKFEAWIRDAIGSDFRWCVRLQDTSANREMVAGLIREDIERGNGVFPQ